MSLLDTMLDVAKKAQVGTGEQNRLLDGLMSMLGGTDAVGGLAGLVEKFQKNGLDDVMSSWIGTGQNLPISADQIRKVLGNSQIQQLAQQAGIQPERAASSLADLLPTVIDRLTPDGKLPEGGLLEQGLSLLKGKLFG